MTMFARFDENPAMTLQDIKETKRNGWTHGRTVYPPQTKFAGIGKLSNCSIKAVEEVDWPMKTPSMHIQKPY